MTEQQQETLRDGSPKVPSPAGQSPLEKGAPEVSTQVVTSGGQVKAEVETKDGIIDVMWSYQTRFDQVLPTHINVRTFLGLAAGALWRSPELMNAAVVSPGSLMNALVRCASLGHQPGTDEFYLTPRKVKGKWEVLGIEGYRGIVERMYRSGAVANVIVREVCQHDKFEFVEGLHDRPQHSIDWWSHDRGPMVGVYAYATLTTGSVSRVVVLNRQDIEVIKARSDSAKSGSEYSPWVKDERAMWWKSAARRLEPWVPTSAEYRREQLRGLAQAAQQDPTSQTGEEDEPGNGEVGVEATT